ncbi:MAG: ISAzo13 family transposase [Deltaproteobacteria bacterium]|jgi:transposase|nr:ISAzo13 family transposase [Deltaproteobacteria bacterium]
MRRSKIKEMWDRLSPNLNERQRRLLAATFANAIGYGGATAVHEETGVSLNTITAGKKELRENPGDLDGRIRRKGGGPKLTEHRRPEVQEKLGKIVDADPADPGKALSWTTESPRKVSARLLTEHGIKTSHATVGLIFDGMGFVKHSHRTIPQAVKPLPDRNAQFEFIDAKAREFIAAGDPVISVDLKKQGESREFSLGGLKYSRNASGRRDADLGPPFSELLRKAPRGVFSLSRDAGFLNLDRPRDLAEFAAECVSAWWDRIGRISFPDAARLMVACDCPSRDGEDARGLSLWKRRLFRLAIRTGLEIHVSHFPLGTSKWNAVTHRLFCYVSEDPQGERATEILASVSLVSPTAAPGGLAEIRQGGTVHGLSEKARGEESGAPPPAGIPPFADWNYFFRAP